VRAWTWLRDSRPFDDRHLDDKLSWMGVAATHSRLFQSSLMNAVQGLPQAPVCSRRPVRRSASCLGPASSAFRKIWTLESVQEGDTEQGAPARSTLAVQDSLQDVKQDAPQQAVQMRQLVRRTASCSGLANWASPQAPSTEEKEAGGRAGAPSAECARRGARRASVNFAPDLERTTSRASSIADTLKDVLSQATASCQPGSQGANPLRR